MEGGGAYGAGKATGQFDPVEYAKKPQVIARAVSMLLAIIVFSCILSQGYNKRQCLFNNDPNACNYGIVIGIFACLGLIGFLIVDALFANISNVQQRKYLVIADIVFSGLWTFLWFVAFCYLADAWRRTDLSSVFFKLPRSGARAAIAFSFFSIFSFGASAYLAVQRYRQGVTEQFAPSEGAYNADPAVGVGPGQQPITPPYSAYSGGDSGDPYQQPTAFGEQRTAPAANFTPTY